MSRQGWTNFQDTLLLQAYEKHSDKWQFISTAFPGKTAVECAARYKILSERGGAPLYHSLKKVNAVKKEFVPKSSPFAVSNSIENQKRVIYFM
jgi:hypothetical protein